MSECKCTNPLSPISIFMHEDLTEVLVCRGCLPPFRAKPCYVCERYMQDPWKIIIYQGEEIVLCKKCVPRRTCSYNVALKAIKNGKK